MKAAREAARGARGGARAKTRSGLADPRVFWHPFEALTQLSTMAHRVRDGGAAGGEIELPLELY